MNANPVNVDRVIPNPWKVLPLVVLLVVGAAPLLASGPEPAASPAQVPAAGAQADLSALLRAMEGLPLDAGVVEEA